MFFKVCANPFLYVKCNCKMLRLQLEQVTAENEKEAARLARKAMRS
jgi:hypothetical protein